MLRIVIALVSLGLGVGAELRGLLAGTEAWVRPLLWVSLGCFAVAMTAGGISALRSLAREEKRYAEPGRRWWRLSPLGAALIQPFILAALVVFIFAGQTEIEIKRSDWPPKTDLLHMPKKDVLRFLSLGYREFVADLVWIRAVAYFGEHLSTDHKYRWLDRYLDTVVYLDPRFRSVYKFAGTVTMYNLNQITKKAVMASIRYLEKGYKQFPNYWEFPFMICSNYLFELPRFARDEAERRRFREIGAEYCREASLLPGTLYYLPSMAGGVLSKLGQRQLARKHFRELILRTEDPKVRSQLQQRYAALVSDSAAHRLEREAAAFFRAHKESFPYVNSDLFLQIGRRGDELDGAASIRRALRGAAP